MRDGPPRTPGSASPAPALETPLPHGVICADPHMQQVWSLVRRVAAIDSTVLVTGPSGTGKELVARTLHRLSDRREQRFVAINCAAIPRELMESELFGHEKGSFTGAAGSKVGQFEFASGGTLFLDEISCLGPDLQAKLLRVLQEREITRVGGLGVTRVDARMVAATNHDLRELIARGGFREDLYYRLNVIPIELPPLEQRPGDILPIARHILAELSKRLDRPGLRFDVVAEAALRSYPWPGNARELANVVERMAALARTSTLGLEDVPPEVRGAVPAASVRERTLRGARDGFERWLIRRTLDEVGWRMKAAADALGVHRNTLHQKMQALGIAGAERDADVGARAATANGKGGAPCASST